MRPAFPCCLVHTPAGDPCPNAHRDSPGQAPAPATDAQPRDPSCHLPRVPVTPSPAPLTRQQHQAPTLQRL